MKELKRRLLKRISIKPNGCWWWTGSAVTGGYGNMSYKRQSLYTHRASWIVHNGPIPKGLSVLHRCDNRLCINPEHLYLGTQADNIADMHAKGRSKHRNGAILTDDEVIEIKLRLIEGCYSQTYLAALFGVSRSTILNINLGHNWKHIVVVPTLTRRGLSI